MKEIKLYTISEAIDEIKKIHDSTTNRPLLVAVYGSGQDSGKTYFIKNAVNALQRKGKTLEAYGTESPEEDFIIKNHYNELEYLFYHIPYNDRNPSKLFSVDAWNKKIRPFTGRNTDVNIFIFNPNFTKPDLEDLTEIFNILISNPTSIRKNLEEKVYQ